VTQLRKGVLEELERRNYSQATVHADVSGIRRFAEYFHRSPDQLGCEHVREYQLHLVQERKLHLRTVMIQMAALRFLFLKVLKRRYSRDDLPLPKLLRRQVPSVLSRDEVARLIDSTANSRHRTILMALYSTGMRRSELCHSADYGESHGALGFTVVAEQFFEAVLGLRVSGTIRGADGGGRGYQTGKPPQKSTTISRHHEVTFPPRLEEYDAFDDRNNSPEVAAYRRLRSIPRHSARMTHFCSLRLTHTKNTICRWARDGASDIIHAEGVRGDFPSSVAKANGLRLQEETACAGETIDRQGAAGPARTALAIQRKCAFARRQHTTQLAVVGGHSWRAKYGHFSRAPKPDSAGPGFRFRWAAW
jgi:hypothetical protein